MANPTLMLIWCGGLGLVIGSFLNVVIYRLPRKCMSIFGARSACPNCLTGIAWYDNIPVISYLFLLRGRCRHCGGRISPRYMMVELMTGGFFLVLGRMYLVDCSAQFFVSPTWPLFVIYAVFVSALIAITFIDIDLRIIPNEISIGVTCFALVASFACPMLHKQGLAGVPGPWADWLAGLPWGANLVGFASSVMGLLFGVGIIYVVAVLGKLAFKKDAMGGGDLKLLAMIGALIGWQGTIVVFLVGCCLGAAVGAVVMAFTKDHYMPFGPYLAAGAAVYLFLLRYLTLGYEWYVSLLKG